MGLSDQDIVALSGGHTLVSFYLYALMLYFYLCMDALTYFACFV
jgi:hypothetical protein